MYCWSCGKPLENGSPECPHCGATVGSGGRGPSTARFVLTCSGCGYRGEGVPYFQRAGHVLLLLGIGVFTYGIGAFIFWRLKSDSIVCPSCGTGWRGGRVARPAEAPKEEAEGKGDLRRAPRGTGGLPSGGGFRRFLGVAMMLAGLFLFGIGVVGSEEVPALIGSLLGAAGASFAAWGWAARRRRVEALKDALERETLRLAQARGGRLTVTDVASELDISMTAAERILFSLDDGFRVQSDVTDEGLLVFDFSEIRARPKLGSAGSAAATKEGNRA